VELDIALRNDPIFALPHAAKLDGINSSKFTEKEYYSRAVKKKVAALANVELHRLSRMVLEL
jgi:hypothetical protein